MGLNVSWDYLEDRLKQQIAEEKERNKLRDEKLRLYEEEQAKFRNVILLENERLLAENATLKSELTELRRHFKESGAINSLDGTFQCSSCVERELLEKGLYLQA